MWSFFSNSIAFLYCHRFEKRVFKSTYNQEVHLSNSTIVSLSSTVRNRKLEESPGTKTKENEQRIDFSVF